MSFSPKQYILTNNIKVANNRADLLDGAITTAINMTELKVALPNNPMNCAAQDAPELLVWTNTATNGAAVGNDCSIWTTVMADQDGGVGMANKKDAMWTNACPLSCDKQARFYCVEQPPP